MDINTVGICVTVLLDLFAYLVGEDTKNGHAERGG